MPPKTSLGVGLKLTTELGTEGEYDLKVAIWFVLGDAARCWESWEGGGWNEERTPASGLVLEVGYQGTAQMVLYKNRNRNLLGTARNQAREQRGKAACFTFGHILV